MRVWHSDAFQQVSAAVAANDAAAATSLLQRNPHLKARLNDPLPTELSGTVALQVAVRRANRAMIDALLDAGADINQRSHWWAGSFGVLDDADRRTGCRLPDRARRPARPDGRREAQSPGH